MIEIQVILSVVYFKLIGTYITDSTFLAFRSTSLGINLQLRHYKHSLALLVFQKAYIRWITSHVSAVGG